MAKGDHPQAHPRTSMETNILVCTCTQTSAGTWKALISTAPDGLSLTPPTLALPTPPTVEDGENALRPTTPAVGKPPPEGVQYVGYYALSMLTEIHKTTQ